MARRNLFKPPPLPGEPKRALTADEQKARFPSTGAMSGMKSTLKDVASNAVREIPVDAIEEKGPKDRLSFSDTEVATLAESIKTHGQQVPIMVRPLTDKPGHYKIVYGRRRLRALRTLGIPAKALVRSLSDEEAILAQGQENTQRLDPSFIEKALFAAELAKSGYGQVIIQDALAVDKSNLSRMNKVARSIPKTVIEQIGSAHGIGRRRWEQLADQTRQLGVDLAQLTAKIRLDTTKTSEDRFGLVSDAVTKELRPKDAPRQARSPERSVKLDDGTTLMELKETPRALIFKLTKSEKPEFAEWMRNNAEAELIRLYEVWQSEQKSD